MTKPVTTYGDSAPNGIPQSGVKPDTITPIAQNHGPASAAQAGSAPGTGKAMGKGTGSASTKAMIITLPRKARTGGTLPPSPAATDAMLAEPAKAMATQFAKSDTPEKPDAPDADSPEGGTIGFSGTLSVAAGMTATGALPAYEVGYGKPPQHSRFRKGLSGNPKGKRRGLPDLAAIVREELERSISVQEAGRKRKMKVLQVAIRSLVTKAAKGDLRALADAIRYGEDPARENTQTRHQPDAAEDQAIILRFLQRLDKGDQKS